jgi:hypothetical protein
METEETALDLLNHPFRLMVSGRTLSGKTTTTVKFIKYMLKKSKWQRILLVCPTAAQDTFNPIRTLILKVFDSPSEDTYDLIYRLCSPKSEKKLSPVRTLLIVDDCSADGSTNKGRKGAFSRLANNARWLNLSMIVISQNMSSISPAFRDNAEGLMLFHTMNKKERQYILDERNPFPKNSSAMESILDSAITEPFDFYFQVNSVQGVFHFKRFDINLVYEDNNISSL